MKRWGRAVMAGVVVVVLAGLAAPAVAQTATVAVEEENFRAEPGGSILAELLRGTPLTIGETRGEWREATFEAWIWARSVHEQRSGELDLLVHADGENLRASPNGDRIGRALGGMRLDRLEARGDWVRIRRTGWIWSPSLQVPDVRASEAAAPERPASVPAQPPPAPGRPPGAASPAAETGGVQTGGAQEQETGMAPEREARPRTAALRFGTVGDDAIVLTAPAGDTVGRLRAGTSVEVLAREGDWTRIRVEGWTFSGAMAGAGSTPGDVVTGLSRDSLQADPEAYRGRVLDWSIQYIALQSAERFRSDFREGEPFMLARGPGDDPGFVYVAIPREWVERVERLSPLEEVRVLGRVRTARSTLTGAPVLDLMELVGR